MPHYRRAAGQSRLPSLFGHFPLLNVVRLQTQVCLCIVAECDIHCLSGCNTEGVAKCDSLCERGYSLNMNDHTCMRKNFV